MNSKKSPSRHLYPIILSTELGKRNHSKLPRPPEAMLRRPPTTLTLTAEDVAAYEDRRFAAAAESQTQTDSRATSHPLLPQQQLQPTAMDTSSSSVTPSPPPAGDDEDMQDADAEDPDTSDPFLAPRRAAREQFSGREQSPGAQRAAYLQQMRATRSQQQQQQTPNVASTAGHTPAAPPTRMQRITGTTQQAGTTRTAGTTTRGAASRQGSTEPSAVPAPAPAPGRMMTRSREERIGIAGSNTGTGAGTGAGSRRREQEQLFMEKYGMLPIRDRHGHEGSSTHLRCRKKNTPTTTAILLNYIIAPTASIPSSSVLSHPTQQATSFPGYLIPSLRTPNKVRRSLPRPKLSSSVAL
ncbi:hypothetical protein M434DRAFT_12448 [Hypoxylon sp. CO27-5]|nr:hypothetical protein M434DRAFT_12448 [Hypoxylon sp. CO27-5]